MTAVEYRGQTTLVTGASSGIGAEFAREFARRGSDVVLVARRPDRLEGLAVELTADHGVRAEAIPLDLSLPASGRTLAEEVDRRGLAVTSLVNNAGFGTFGPFHTEDPERLRQEINVDVASVVDISRAFIGRLRANGGGVLINVASMAAYQPIPNMAVYAATKAFVLNFTEALWQESLGTGLRVVALSPGYPHRVQRRRRHGGPDQGSCFLRDAAAGGGDGDAGSRPPFAAVQRRLRPDQPPDGERGPVAEPAARGAGRGLHDEDRQLAVSRGAPRRSAPADGPDDRRAR